MECEFALYLDYCITLGVTVLQCSILCWLTFCCLARGQIKKRNKKIVRLTEMQTLNRSERGEIVVVSHEPRGEKEKK